jgi:hypothetical protein
MPLVELAERDTGGLVSHLASLLILTQYSSPSSKLVCTLLGGLGGDVDSGLYVQYVQYNQTAGMDEYRIQYVFQANVLFDRVEGFTTARPPAVRRNTSNAE